MKKWRKVLIYSPRFYQIPLFLLLSASFFLSSHAWITNRRISDKPSELQGGTAENLELQIGTVPFGQTEEQRVFTKISPDENDVYTLGFSGVEADGAGYHIEMNDMRLGAIDNMMFLYPENKIYLRLVIPAQIGSGVHFKLYYGGVPGRHINVYKNLYDSAKNVIGQQNILNDPSDMSAPSAISGLLAVESEHKSFLRFEYSLSGAYIENGQMHGPGGEEALDFSSGIFYFNDFTNEGSAQVNAVYDGGYNNADGGEYYYLYVKITPNLSALGYSIQHLSKYMPCFVTFNIGAQFEIT